MWKSHATVEMRGLDVNISDRAVVDLLRLERVIRHASEQALRSDAIARVAGAYHHVVPSAREARRAEGTQGGERARHPGASRESKQRARDVLIAKLDATRAKMHILSSGGAAMGSDRLSPTDSMASSRSGGRSRGSG